MTDIVRRCDACLEALSAPAMTDAEMQEHLSRCAEEDARAERRRMPSPQLELGDHRG